MPITVTWNDGTNPATQFVMPDDVIASLDQFRKTITSFQNGSFQPTYPDVQSLVVGIFVTSMVMPALQAFPTPAVQTAQTNLESAQTALATAQLAAIPNFAPVTGS